jgi:hypothetical protein
LGLVQASRQAARSCDFANFEPGFSARGRGNVFSPSQLRFSPDSRVVTRFSPAPIARRLNDSLDHDVAQEAAQGALWKHSSYPPAS